MTEREFGGVLVLFAIGIAILSIIVSIIVWWRIFAKAGFSGALGLLMLVPIANVVMLLVLAFAEWPIQAELRQLRAYAQQTHAYFQQYGYYPHDSGAQAYEAPAYAPPSQPPAHQP